MTSPIELRFTLTPEEVISSTRWLTFRRLRPTFLILGILVLGVAGAMAVIDLRRGRTGGLGWGSLLLAWFALVFWYSMSLAPARTYRRLPATFREGEHFWRFSEDGAEYRGPTLEAKFLWSTWIAFAETHTCFLLLPQRHLAHMVPKRAFGSAEEVSLFRDLARSRILPG